MTSRRICEMLERFIFTDGVRSALFNILFHEAETSPRNDRKPAASDSCFSDAYGEAVLEQTETSRRALESWMEKTARSQPADGGHCSITDSGQTLTLAPALRRCSGKSHRRTRGGQWKVTFWRLSN